MIRTIKLELTKPLSESWDDFGPTMRLLLKATPKVLRAAYDARVAGDIVGAKALKIAVCPEVKGASFDGIAYQAAKREVENLRAWGKKKKNDFARLEMPGGMVSQISRTACQALSAEKKARREGRASSKGRTGFTSELIFARAAETRVSRADDGTYSLTVTLRPKGSASRVTLAVSPRIRGGRRDTLRKIAAGEYEHGDCKLKWDARRKKLYAFLAYEMPDAAPLTVDPKRALVLHRGIRCALYLLSTDGKTKPLNSNLISVRKRQLARHRDPGNEGRGARGHGTKRRNRSRERTRGVIDRTTRTIFQQLAAYVVWYALANGYGLILIEDYGGIEPDDERAIRRVMAAFNWSLYGLKQAILEAAEKAGITVKEVPSAYISSTCPACENADTAQHNTRTDVFHCKRCSFERPADWVAAYWMMRHGDVDTSAIDEMLARQRKLTESLRKVAG
jgi:hypothetical protein